MRRGLLWLLVASVAASGAVLWTSDQAPRVVAAVTRTSDSQAALESSRPLAGVSMQLVPLPEQLEPAAIEPASRDIFAPVPPPAPKVVAAPPKPAEFVFVGPPAPVVPTAPAATYRFLGRMTTPTGESLVFLASASKTVAVKAGDRLDDGYVVEAISDQNVQLIYPTLDVRVAIPLPRPPGS